MAEYSIENAYDAIMATFWDHWRVEAPLVNDGVVPEIEWPNAEPSDEPLSKGNKPWARFNIRHTFRDQAGIGNGNRIFTPYGTITVQIFVPAGKQGLALPARLGKVAVDAFEGKHSADGEIWFRNVVYREAGRDGPWYQANVTAGFTYDVVK